MKIHVWLRPCMRIGTLAAVSVVLLGVGCETKYVLPVDASVDSAPVFKLSLFVPGGNGAVESEIVQAGGTIYATRNTDVMVSGSAANPVGGMTYFRLDAYGTTPCTAGNPASFTAQTEASANPDGMFPEILSIQGANGDGTAGSRYAICLKVVGPVEVHADAKTPSGLQTTIKILVLPLDPLAPTITVTPSSITAGGSATLAWSAQNATSASISPIGSTALNDSVPVNPTSPTTYTLTASQPFPGPLADFPGVGNRKVVETRTATLDVQAVPTPPPAASPLSGTVKFRAVDGDRSIQQEAYAQLSGASAGDTFSRMSYGHLSYRLDGAVRSVPFTVSKNLAAGSWTITAYISNDLAGNSLVTGFLQCTYTLPQPFGVTIDIDQQMCN